jgi:hypothetical protein
MCWRPAVSARGEFGNPDGGGDAGTLVILGPKSGHQRVAVPSPTLPLPRLSLSAAVVAVEFGMIAVVDLEVTARC